MAWPTGRHRERPVSLIDSPPIGPQVTRKWTPTNPRRPAICSSTSGGRPGGRPSDLRGAIAVSCITCPSASRISLRLSQATSLTQPVRHARMRAGPGGCGQVPWTVAVAVASLSAGLMC